MPLTLHTNHENHFTFHIPDLRLAVRGNQSRKHAAHKHEFGEEVYNEEEDEYSKTCITCGYIMTFEKM